MINFNNEKNMYDLFIDNKVLTTQDLLGVGFTNKDLTRLIEAGKIKRVSRGFYELASAQGLFKYSLILSSKRCREYEKSKKALRRCVEIEPDNGSIQTRLFLNAIVDDDYDTALKCFEVMDKTDNIRYKKDQNLWLFLLSFICELPNEYMSRLKDMKLDDILTLKDDNRYPDRLLQNKIRNAIWRQSFKEASNLSKTMQKPTDKKIGSIITEKLLGKAIFVYCRDHDYLYDLIMKGKYEEVLELLTTVKEKRGLNLVDEQFLVVVSDMLYILNEKKIPLVDEDKQILTFTDALMAHDYEKLLEIYRLSAGRKTSKSSKFMGILLERIDNEITKLRNQEVENVEVVENNQIASDADRRFSLIASSLMGGDVDMAFQLLDDYLATIGKSEFRGYVADLIKLSLLKKDVSFTEPILLLSVLSRDEFDFNVATYIQDFYFNVARNNFKEAAIYLDILSMSEALGGIKIPTRELRDKLIEDAKDAGISAEELGLVKKEVLPTPPVAEDEKNDGSIDSLISKPYDVESAVNDILNDTNLIMLEAMNDDEIRAVVDMATSVPKVQAITIEEADGKKRVLLRYYDKHGPYVNISENLKLANTKYRNWEYDEAIELYQSVLPKIETPRSFIFARLGECYRKTTYDGDYSKAIDYYTMAMAQSSREAEPLDYTDLISELKKKSNYDGVKVQLGEESIQYKKEM